VGEMVVNQESKKLVRLKKKEFYPRQNPARENCRQSQGDFVLQLFIGFLLIFRFRLGFFSFLASMASTSPTLSNSHLLELQKEDEERAANRFLMAERNLDFYADRMLRRKKAKAFLNDMTPTQWWSSLTSEKKRMEIPLFHPLVDDGSVKDQNKEREEKNKSPVSFRAFIEYGMSIGMFTLQWSETYESAAFAMYDDFLLSNCSNESDRDNLGIDVGDLKTNRFRICDNLGVLQKRHVYRHIAPFLLPPVVFDPSSSPIQDFLMVTCPSQPNTLLKRIMPSLLIHKSNPLFEWETDDQFSKRIESIQLDYIPPKHPYLLAWSLRSLAEPDVKTGVPESIKNVFASRPELRSHFGENTNYHLEVTIPRRKRRLNKPQCILHMIASFLHDSNPSNYYDPQCRCSSSSSWKCEFCKSQLCPWNNMRHHTPIGTCPSCSIHGPEEREARIVEKAQGLERDKNEQLVIQQWMERRTRELQTRVQAIEEAEKRELELKTIQSNDDDKGISLENPDADASDDEKGVALENPDADASDGGKKSKKKRKLGV
jgi:hypothetical protein